MCIYINLSVIYMSRLVHKCTDPIHKFYDNKHKSNDMLAYFHNVYA